MPIEVQVNRRFYSGKVCGNDCVISVISSVVKMRRHRHLEIKTSRYFCGPARSLIETKKRKEEKWKTNEVHDKTAVYIILFCKDISIGSFPPPRFAKTCGQTMLDKNISRIRACARTIFTIPSLMREGLCWNIYRVCLEKVFNFLFFLRSLSIVTWRFKTNNSEIRIKRKNTYFSPSCYKSTLCAMIFSPFRLARKNIAQRVD